MCYESVWDEKVCVCVCYERVCYVDVLRACVKAKDKKV